MKNENDNKLSEIWDTPEVNVLSVKAITEDVLSENFYNNINS